MATFFVAATAGVTAGPSRPATTSEAVTLRNGAPSGDLEDWCLGVGAEHILQGADDLALGSVYARALQQVRHQVDVGKRRRRPELGELRLDGRRVAARADRLHAADLLALERGIDAEDRRRVVVALGVRVHADDDPVA